MRDDGAFGMRGVAIGMMIFWTACAGPNGASGGRPERPGSSSPSIPKQEPVTSSPRPAATEGQRSECAAAEKAFSDALAAAASGCQSTDDCDVFASCHPVLAASTPMLWKLKDRARDTCRPVRDVDDVLSCATRTRCVKSLCIRFPG
jgi:hypothetical protein